jgi:hypothetical protein
MKCASTRSRDLDNHTLKKATQARLWLRLCMNPAGVRINDEAACDTLRAFKKGKWPQQILIPMLGREQR